MPLFRSGKPYRLRTLTANLAQGSSPFTVPWSSDESDGEWALPGTTSTVLAIELTGLYIVTAALGHTAGTGAQSSSLEIHRNGAVVVQSQSVSSAGRIGCSASFTDMLSTGDTISLVASNLALTGGKLIDAGITRLCVTRIGPKRWT